MERGGVKREEEGCVEEINLHSASASAQRQLMLQSSTTGFKHRSWNKEKLTDSDFNCSEKKGLKGHQQLPSVTRWVWHARVVKPICSVSALNSERGAIFSHCVSKEGLKFSPGYTLEETGRGWRFVVWGVTLFLVMKVKTKICCEPHLRLKAKRSLTWSVTWHDWDGDLK